MIYLLKNRSFIALFICQFLGAMNDNLFRTAIVTMITFTPGVIEPSLRPIIITIAMGLFMLPYFAFSASGGLLADNRDKGRLIRKIKLAEIIIMLLGTVGFIMQWPWFLLSILFLMGTQSAFFGPVKYSILPDILPRKQLVAGNGMIEGGTYIAILLGMIVGGLFVIGSNNAAYIISALILLVAVTGFLVSFHIKLAKPYHNKQHSFHINIIRSTIEVLSHLREGTIFMAVIAVSWFWTVGSVVMAQLPNFVRDVLLADNQVFTMLLAIFSLGVGIGAMLCHKLLAGKITARYAAPAALMMILCLLYLVWASDDYSYIMSISGHNIALGSELIHNAQSAISSSNISDESLLLLSISDFMANSASTHIILAIIGIAISGGIFVVPIMSILQDKAAHNTRSQIIAVNNIANAAFMVVASLISSILLAIGLAIADIFLIVVLFGLVMAVLLWFKLKY